MLCADVTSAHERFQATIHLLSLFNNYSQLTAQKASLYFFITSNQLRLTILLIFRFDNDYECNK